MTCSVGELFLLLTRPMGELLLILTRPAAVDWVRAFLQPRFLQLIGLNGVGRHC